jgi:hypothetical protein
MLSGTREKDTPKARSSSPREVRSPLPDRVNAWCDAQRLLLLAAAEPLGDSALLWRAADRLAIGAEAADASTSVGLVEFGARVYAY